MFSEGSGAPCDPPGVVERESGFFEAGLGAGDVVGHAAVEEEALFVIVEHIAGAGVVIARHTPPPPARNCSPGSTENPELLPAQFLGCATSQMERIPPFDAVAMLDLLSNIEKATERGAMCMPVWESSWSG